MPEFLTRRIPQIYLVYGLSLLALGLALTLELSRVLESRFKQALSPLAVFDLVNAFASVSRCSSALANRPTALCRRVVGVAAVGGPGVFVLIGAASGLVGIRERAQLAAGSATSSKGTILTVEITMQGHKGDDNVTHQGDVGR